MANSGRPLMVDKIFSQLGDNTRGTFSSKKEMAQMLTMLSKIIPDWILVQTLPAG